MVAMATTTFPFLLTDAGKLIGFLIPLIVNSPSIIVRSPSVRTLVISKLDVGFFETLKKSSDAKCPCSLSFHSPC
jgi:hypothetical protein